MRRQRNTPTWLVRLVQHWTAELGGGGFEPQSQHYKLMSFYAAVVVLKTDYSGSVDEIQ